MSSAVGEQIFEYEGESTVDVSPQIHVFKDSLKARLSLADNDECLSSASINAVNGFEYFSGRLYVGASNEYSIADKIGQRVESPQQRIHRLRSELAALVMDLDQMVEEVGIEILNS